MDKAKFLTHPPESEFITLSDHEFAADIFTYRIKNKQIYPDGLYRDGIIKQLTGMGYYKRYHIDNTYCFIKDLDNILDEVEPCVMKDSVFEKMKARYKGTIAFEYDGIRAEVEAEKLHDIFLKQDHLIFNDTFLEHLATHTKPILKDTANEAFFPFKNIVVKVTKDDVTPLDYSTLSDLCIWRTHILKREYKEPVFDGCHFADFVANISNEENEHIQAICTAIGYLLHNYCHPSNGQAVIAYDEEITDLRNPMGGTGKGIIQQALSQLRKVVIVDGKKFNEKDRFCFQDIDERTQVVFFDDVKADMGFDRFNSILTEGWTVEKKMRPSFFIPPQDSPKVYITSNAIIQGEGTTAKRRQFIIELSPFYSNLIKQNLEPIRHVHGCDFFGDDWDEIEWNKFYRYMLQTAQSYFKTGLKYYKPKGLNANKLRQSTSEEFYEWILTKKIDRDTEYEMGGFFEDFKLMYYGENSDFHRRTFTNWLKLFAKMNDLELKLRRANNVSYFKFQD